jgi:hypothetical protein
VEENMKVEFVASLLMIGVLSGCASPDQVSEKNEKTYTEKTYVTGSNIPSRNNGAPVQNLSKEQAADLIRPAVPLAPTGSR